VLVIFVITVPQFPLKIQFAIL